jgi:hypothetical protein
MALNLSNLGPGARSVVTQRFRPFDPSTTYQISVAFQDKGQWKDANNTNDLRTMVVVFGEREPPVPLWGRPLFIYIFGGTMLVGLMAVAYFLIRKRL